MKYKKILLVMFLMLMFVTLVSCNGKGYVGTYKFQLGKDKGTHFAISLELTDEAVVKNEQELGKKFIFAVDSKKADTPTTTIDPSTLTTSGGADEDALDDIERTILSDLKLTGYYTVAQEEDGKHRLNIGLTGISTALFSKEDLNLDDYGIEPAIIEQIILIEITDTSAIIKAPVSGNDLLYQLYWYGHDFSIADLDFKEVEAHQVGTHPTKADIDKINETFPDSHNGDKFRDYYTISMGLAKE